MSAPNFKKSTKVQHVSEDMEIMSGEIKDQGGDDTKRYLLHSSPLILRDCW